LLTRFTQYVSSFTKGNDINIQIHNIALALWVAWALSGCGGARNSTLGGIAAVGSPIVNGIVQVKCAGGDAFGTTTTDGSWQVTLSEHPLPCAVEIRGGKINNIDNPINYHSVTSNSYTANVTPLTDLAVANLAGNSPDAWFAGLADATLMTITTSSVDTALSNLSTALSGLPPLSKINPITTKFTAVPGDPTDDMLAALQIALSNTNIVYPTLLDSASTGFSSAYVTNLNTALSLAYEGIINGSILSVTSFTPGSGAAGTPVTITGANFSTKADDDLVKFNGIPANVISATATQLIAIVPTTATSGIITVTTGSQTTSSTFDFTVPPGTAAHYFTKTKVNNTWSWLWTTGATSTRTIIASVDGVVTFFETLIYSDGSNTNTTHTDHIDTLGAWVSTDASGAMHTVLPATFSVGNSYTISGSNIATIAAFNVTNPAGTFTDCLQIYETFSASDSITYYLSPTAGAVVETTLSSSGTIYTEQLQAGYIAN
jgi:hypothetical protein